MQLNRLYLQLDIASGEVARMGPEGLRRFMRVLEEEKPAILHSYRDIANFWARLAVAIVRVPVVLTSCRRREMARRFALAEPLLQRWSDRVLTNSVGVKRELVDRAHVKPDKVQVVHNFIDLDKFRPPTDEERSAARRKHGLADGEIAFVLPGRTSHQKQQLGVARALHRLKRRGALPPNLRILMAGRDYDRFYSLLLPRALGLLGVAGAVRRLGMIADSDMPALYHAADVILMPSLFEGLPNAVIEGHSSGLPAVVSRDANLDGLVLPGVSGFEHATGNPAELADAIERMAALSVEERRAMGLRGRENIAARFNPERVLAETVALYDELLRKKGMA